MIISDQLYSSDEISKSSSSGQADVGLEDVDVPIFYE